MLKFASFTSDIELSFYASLASQKINHDKLDDSARRLLGIYEIRPSEVTTASCRMQLHGNALTSENVPSNCFRADGTIKNYNTIEEYRNSNKTEILDRTARTVWEAIKDDLKKYKFTYLFGFPALHSDPAWNVFTPSETLGDQTESSEKSWKSFFSSDISTALVDAVQTWRYSVDSRQWGFFLAKQVELSTEHDAGKQHAKVEPLEGASEAKVKWVIGSLGEYENDFFKGVQSSNQYICFADPATYEDHPGWPLRNLLALVQYRWKMARVQILCYRDTHARRHEARSIVLNLIHDSTEPADVTTMPKATGWERNVSGKVVSKVANLGDYMDPTKLADQAVDLNLKLIKWRIAPQLDLDIIKNTRCLLLGAGTLGSYVSRNLLGWGVRKITFVDNGNVSFSNPVRQPLFSFADCLSGGTSKAERAAQALKEIYPGVESAGYSMSVPMAGHPIIDESKTLEEYKMLEKLYLEHDVVFLLMDTRESRWLPTVMGRAKDKLVMNAALGFDTYVVMRHGTGDRDQPGGDLGCYFCNDVVAPADSMSDRTLDQQCTVTRPGVAAIASALLVEMMVSILQDSVSKNAEPKGGDNPLGAAPHTIRGFLSNWSNMNLTGKSYSQCSACSPVIVEAYEKQGWNFVKQALNEKDFVAELSGLAELQRQAEKAAALVDWEDDGEENPADLDDDGILL